MLNTYRPDPAADAAPTRQPPDWPGRLWSAVEIAGAGLLTAAFLVALWGELPYHDALRFAAQINSGLFVFDIAHVYMQPLTLLWHRAFGAGQTAMDSQRQVNMVAVALAAAVFHALLLRLRIGPVRRVAATVLLVGSCSVVTLAPSAHMKLMAFPFVNGALYALTVWEQERRRGAAALRMLALGGLLLAVAASLLISALATAPFAALAVLWAAWRIEGRWAPAWWRAIVFSVVCGTATCLLVALGFVLFADQPLTPGGIVAAVAGKAGLMAPSYDLRSSIVRLVFGTANNMMAAPDLGSIGRALVAGQIRSAGPYVPTLVSEGVPWLLTLILLGLIYLRAVIAAVRGAACLVPLAFLCGAQAWTIYYGLNDPEHWFQLTAPTLMLALLLFPPRLGRVVLPLWAAMALAVNLVLIGLPTARYPLARDQAELSRLFSPKDLLISFAAYPGGAYLGFFYFPGVPRMRLDQVVEARGRAAAFTELGETIDAALARGGRVFVFGVLDPRNWNAPWPSLYRAGVTKPALHDFLAARYSIEPVASMAEIETWQIKPRRR